MGRREGCGFDLAAATQSPGSLTLHPKAGGDTDELASFFRLRFAAACGWR